MAWGTCALVVSAVTLLLSRESVNAFVQPRSAARLLGSKSINSCIHFGSIMSTSTTATRAIMPRTPPTAIAAATERRDFLTELVTTVISGGCVGALSLGLATEEATAYEKEYLKEPTPEFKAMEARQSEFAVVQRAYKQDFVKKLEAFLAVNTSEDAITTLNVMSNTVIQRGGLPESVRINDLLKTCRRKKADMKEGGKWTTPVQIAYERLVQTTNKTVIPLQSGG